jgi:thiosulfate dehydrogenase [quinone] large subunit
MDKTKNSYSKIQLIALVTLRVLIGWHLLYEGIVKLMNPEWSAASYLRDSKWIFSGFFYWIADTSSVLQIVNFLNIWGLIFIGLGLIIGLLSRTSTIAGIVLILFYYLATPPLSGLTYMFPPEGSYLIVNKNLIEIASLVVLLFFPSGKIIGVDRIISKLRRKVS